MIFLLVNLLKRMSCHPSNYPEFIPSVLPTFLKPKLCRVLGFPSGAAGERLVDAGARETRVRSPGREASLK